MSEKPAEMAVEGFGRPIPLTQAPKPGSGDPVGRVDGSGATDTPAEPPEPSEGLRKIAFEAVDNATDAIAGAEVWRVADAVLAALAEVGVVAPMLVPAERKVSCREFIAAEVERLGLQPKVDAMWAEIENAPPPPPGWCMWHQMVDCHGHAPECREARAEVANGTRGDELGAAVQRLIADRQRPTGHVLRVEGDPDIQLVIDGLNCLIGDPPPPSSTGEEVPARG